jgi:hypothetical protein
MTTSTPPAPTLPDESPVVHDYPRLGRGVDDRRIFCPAWRAGLLCSNEQCQCQRGGTVPNSVALFPPPYDLVSQVADPNFLYFVWGQNVVIVDGHTNGYSKPSSSGP